MHAAAHAGRATMGLPPEFWEQLSQRSDLELYEMLVQENLYLPEASEAAMEELRKRKLTLGRMEELRGEMDRSRLLDGQLAADEKLRVRRGKMAFHALMWLGIPLLYLLKELILLAWPR